MFFVAILESLQQERVVVQVKKVVRAAGRINGSHVAEVHIGARRVSLAIFVVPGECILISVWNDQPAVEQKHL